MENLLTSTEIFDTETETWSDGPELPFSLAFATVVSTPLATFIMGGQTVGGDPSSATGQILKLTRDGSGMNPRWEILPYELAVARRAPAAISMNTNNFRNTYEQDCSIEFQALAQKTGYQTRPLEFRKKILLTLSQTLLIRQNFDLPT